MPTHVRVAIIGSGFAGLGMAIQLARHGIDDFVIVERGSEVGGTWRDNTYPGAACDIRSDLYSFSFAPRHDWKHRYGRQAEILDYLRSTADRFGIRPRIRFDTELMEATWDAVAAFWRLHTSTGELTASVLVSAAGPLIDPVWPQIPGLEQFEGLRFHSSRWRHDLDLADLRVAVIGTGRSAWTVGSTSRAANGLQPIRTPSGTPTTTASRKPWPTRCAENSTLDSHVPL